MIGLFGQCITKDTDLKVTLYFWLVRVNKEERPIPGILVEVYDGLRSNSLTRSTFSAAALNQRLVVRKRGQQQAM